MHPVRPFLISVLVLFTAAVALDAAQVQAPQGRRLGIIGLDTSHSPAFAREFNGPDAGPDLLRFKVVAAYPYGSRDIQSSVSRIPKYTEDMKGLGVEIVDSISQLLEKVDFVLLETNDGRPHLEQALEVFKSGKPVFIDKPVAGSLVDAVAIYEAARKYNVPVFSSSSLRFAEKALAARNGSVGQVLEAFTYSPSPLEPTHPDFFWYGIHGVEMLFTVMGTGCEQVVRAHTPGADVAVGTWQGGRLGTFLGMREGKDGYGGIAFGTKEISEIGSYSGYRTLVVEIARFFETGKAPVSPEETIEIFAFMEGADESKRQGGKPVLIAPLLEKARAEAAAKLAGF